MNEDLKAMVQETIETEPNLDIETQITKENTEKEKMIQPEIVESKEEINDEIFDDEINDVLTLEEVIEIPKPHEITLTPFNKWFETHIDNFPNTKKLGIQTSGVDTEKTIVVKTLDLRNTILPNQENVYRLIVFEDADKIIIFDKPGVSLRIFTNECIEIYYDMYTEDYQPNIPEEKKYIFKSYQMKRGPIGVLNYVINDMIIPVYVYRMKKKDTEMIIPEISYDSIVDKLKGVPDKESIKISYKQISKFIDELNTVEDVIKWLIEKKENIIDIAHLIQIDTVIMNILS